MRIRHITDQVIVLTTWEVTTCKIIKYGSGFNQPQTENIRKNIFCLGPEQAWWPTPIIPALIRLRQEDHKLEAGLGYAGR